MVGQRRPDYTLGSSGGERVSAADFDGSGVLPYSVLIDRDGTIRWARLGVLEEADLRRRLGELLASG
jgi:hypothetical protein